MKLINYLAENNVITRDVWEIFMTTLFVYGLAWVLFKYHVLWWAFSSLFMAFGGIANLYVIYFNNSCMPVMARYRKEFKQLKRKNSLRRICMLDKKTKLSWLCDRFYIGSSIYSFGDFMFFFSATLAFLPFILAIV